MHQLHYSILSLLAPSWKLFLVYSGHMHDHSAAPYNPLQARYLTHDKHPCVVIITKIELLYGIGCDSIDAPIKVSCGFDA